MIKHLPHVLLLALTLPFAGTSCAGRMNVSEKMMWSTYPLVTFKGAATGFVINHRDPGAPGGKIPVVFTSVHALETMGKGPLIIGFRIPDAAGGARVALLAFIPPKTTGKEVLCPSPGLRHRRLCPAHPGGNRGPRGYPLLSE